MLALDSETMHKHLKWIHQASPCGQQIALRAETGTWLVSQPISVTHLSLYVTEKKIGAGTVLCDRIRCCRYLLFNSEPNSFKRKDWPCAKLHTACFCSSWVAFWAGPNVLSEKWLTGRLEGKENRRWSILLPFVTAREGCNTHCGLHQLQMSGYTLVEQQHFTCVPWENVWISINAGSSSPSGSWLSSDSIAVSIWICFWPLPDGRNWVCKDAKEEPCHGCWERMEVWLQRRGEVLEDCSRVYFLVQQHQVATDWVILHGRAFRILEVITRRMQDAAQVVWGRMLMSAARLTCGGGLPKGWSHGRAGAAEGCTMVFCVWFPPSATLKPGISEKPSPSGFCPTFFYLYFDSVHILDVFCSHCLARMCH